MAKKCDVKDVVLYILYKHLASPSSQSGVGALI